MANPVSLSELQLILDKLDRPNTVRAVPGREAWEDLQEALREYYEAGREERVAVAGVDIYRYSAFDAERQRLVPLLFRLLFDSTIRDLRKRESLLFPRDEKLERFISTGDGGFLLVASPLAALVFAIYFEAHLQWYNSFISNPNLRALLGPVTVRWALTYDTVFSFEGNWFGSAIITNARLLSRDRLNRCLLDSKSIEWFQGKTGSVENLWPIDNADLCDIMGVPRQKAGTSFLFKAPKLSEETFRNAIVQRVGTADVKGTVLDVYSLFVQARIRHPEAEKNGDHRNTVVSLGNLNSQGLSE